jgi:phosphopentomutase
MIEASAGKDTITGHWEICGVINEEAFPLYPDGFPKELIDRFCQVIGREILGNRPASGTQIIEELGERHLETGFPIIYTSADSVFQIAAHEKVIPPEELYWMCKEARKILKGRHRVGRVIARPFLGEPGRFVRTKRRKDFSVSPPEPTVLNFLKDAGFDVIGIGKIEDIFACSGITESLHTENNLDGIKKTIEKIKERPVGLIFTNLIDFDMLYGHRNDVLGFVKALEEFDRYLPELINVLGHEDLLIITADHGCDPTTPSTDHSREYVPLLVYGKAVSSGVDLGLRKTFADIGKTLDDFFGLGRVKKGESFTSVIL